MEIKDKKVIFDVDDSSLKLLENISKNVDDVDKLFNNWVIKTSNQINSKNKKELEKFNLSTFNENQVANSIESWSTKPASLKYQMLKLYFECEKDGVANRDEMIDKYLNNSTYPVSADRELAIRRFVATFRSMCSDAPLASGEIFNYSRNGDVKLSEKYKEVVLSYQNEFKK